MCRSWISPMILVLMPIIRCRYRGIKDGISRGIIGLSSKRRRRVTVCVFCVSRCRYDALRPRRVTPGERRIGRRTQGQPITGKHPADRRRRQAARAIFPVRLSDTGKIAMFFAVLRGNYASDALQYNRKTGKGMKMTRWNGRFR